MRLVPDPSPLGRPYWEGAARGELLIQRCGACGHVWHPPLPCCPRCRSRDVAWQASGGRGAVHSFTVVHRAGHPALAERVPYVTALVELDEGPRVVGELVGVAPQDAHVGLAVRAEFEALDDGLALVRFARDQDR